MNIFYISTLLIGTSISTYFAFKINNINNIGLFLPLTVLVCLIEVFFFEQYALNNYLLLILILLTKFSIITCLRKEFNLSYIIIPSILMVTFFLSNTVSLIIMPSFFIINTGGEKSVDFTVIILGLLSETLYILLSSLLYVAEKKLDLNKMIIVGNNYCKIFLFFIFSWLYIYVNLFRVNGYILISDKCIYYLIYFFIMAYSFFVIYFMMKKNYYNYLLANDKLVKSYYVDETYKKINRMSYKVLQEKHEMFYMLLNIKRLFFYGEKEEMLSFIDKKIKNFQSYNLSQTLNSPLFDYHIMGYINILKDNGYEIKLAIALNNDMLLENIILVKAMKECIKMCVYYCKYDKNFDLHIYDKNTYLMIKLLFKKSKKDFPILQLEKIMHIKRIDFKKKSDDECELGILFEINDKFL